MFCVHIVRDKNAILVSLVNQRNDVIHALCIRWHIKPFIELIKRAFGAEQVELAVGADLSKLEQSFGVRDRSYPSTKHQYLLNIVNLHHLRSVGSFRKIKTNAVNKQIHANPFI